MFENIPEELQHIGQWINWRYGTTDTGKQTKHPVTPGFGYLASVTDPSTWRTFAEAVSYARNNPSFIAGIGFVFTKETLYSGIDLDHLDNPDDHKRAVAIVEHFDTYTETSPSGRGLHLIVKGKVASGRRKAGVELYPHGRYFTFTGNVVRNRPIASRHFELEELWKELGGAQLDETGFDGDPTQTNSDLEVYNMAVAARNGQLFLDLWQGRWDEQRREDNSKRYTSQSEADFALIDIIAFYTQNREQITRLFFTSALGQREKAQARKDYVPKMIKRSFDRMLPKVNFDAIANQANDARERIEAAVRSAPAYTPPAPAPVWEPPAEAFAAAARPWDVPQAPAVVGYVAPALDAVFPPAVEPFPLPSALATPANATDPFTWPPGLTGAIAQHIFNSVYSPVREYAIAGALAFMAGCAGRAFNVSGDMGLNLYIIVNGGTATGKDGIRTALNKLVEQMTSTVGSDGTLMSEGAAGFCQSIKDFVGPSHIASGQAIGKYLVDHPSIFCVIGEFGHKLRALTNPRSSNDELLKGTLLDLYTSSGYGKSVQSYIYSDKDKNSKPIESPALTLLCEGTPETFYNKLDDDVIIDGFIPRFLIIDYPGFAPEPVEANTTRRLEGWLRVQIGNFVQKCHLNNVPATRSVTIPTFSPEADAMQKEFGAFCRQQIRSYNAEVITQIWSRAHAKVLKIAAILAIGCDWGAPIITVDHIAWAKGLVVHEVEGLLRKFERGEMGSSSPYKADERKQQKEVLRQFVRYHQTAWNRLPNAKTTTPEFHKDGLVPHKWLMNVMANIAAFRNDPSVKTAGDAIKRTVATLVERDILGECNPNDEAFKIRYGKTTQRCYFVKDWEEVSKMT
jgi:hypothetical protein